MFGFGSKNKKSDKRPAPVKGAAAGEQGKTQKSGKPGSGSEALRAQALANARAARTHIGEETLDKIAAAMAQKQKSAMEQAKRRIQDADAERVAGEILAMLSDR